MKNRRDWIEMMLSEAPWLKEMLELKEGRVPAHTLYLSMQDAEKCYKAMITKRTQKLSSKLPFRSKKSSHSFPILGNGITEKGIYPRLLGIIKTKETLPHKPCDSRITCENGKWYLITPYKVKVQNSENQGRICALDPGVRTFVTIFSPTSIHKIGQGDFGRIANLAKHLDNLISRTTKEHGKKKQAMKKASKRLQKRIIHLVDDIHYQTIGWLFRNYGTVVFPEADFTDACKKAKRKLRRKTARSLMTWSFAKFRDRLKAKAEILGKKVIIVNEAYTSKTANWDGETIQNLGGRKTITSQGITVDRDVNGALGIYLKALVDHPLLVSSSSAMDVIDSFNNLQKIIS